MSKELIIEKPHHVPDIPQVEFIETKEVHDKVPNLFLYCTMHPSYHSLQIRGYVPLGHSYKKGLAKRNLIATISLTLDDLRQIAEYVKRYDQEQVDGHYDEQKEETKINCERCGEELKPGREVTLELSNTDGNYYTEIPAGHVSQGGFYFGSACAKAQLQETATENQKKSQ